MQESPILGAATTMLACEDLDDAGGFAVVTESMAGSVRGAWLAATALEALPAALRRRLVGAGPSTNEMAPSAILLFLGFDEAAETPTRLSWRISPTAALETKLFNKIRPSKNGFES